MSERTISLNGGVDFITFRPGSGNTFEILDILVNSERGKGQGRRLVEIMIDELPSDCTLVYAITRQRNRIAQEFYSRLGFYLAGILRDFYKLDEEESEKLGKNHEHALVYGFQTQSRGDAGSSRVRA